MCGNVRKNTNEKVVSIRLSKTDLSDFYKLTENSSTTPKDIFRVGLRKMMEEKRSPNEVKLLSTLKLLEDENWEYDLRVVANNILMDSIREKLDDFESNKIATRKRKIVEEMINEHTDFMNDPRYTLDVRNDLNEFYIIRRNAIELIAMYNGSKYEDAVEYYDEYFEKQVELSENNEIYSIKGLL